MVDEPGRLSGEGAPEDASSDQASQLEQICQRLLETLRDPNYQPVKTRVLAKRLGLSAPERTLLRRVLRRLQREGKVVWDAQRRVKLVTGTHGESDRETAREVAEEVSHGPEPEAAQDFLDIFGDRPSEAHIAQRIEEAKRRASKDTGLVVGVVRRTAGGHAFVRPQTEEPGAYTGRQDDIFIPQKKALDAATGDLVLVRLSPRSRGARKRGVILEVLRREDYRFVGTYQQLDGQPVVFVDGRVFSAPVPVGDPTAKGVRPGDQVVIEMVRFPRHYDPGEAVILEVLGARGEPGVDTLAIIREYDLPTEFPEAVLAEARQQAALFDESIGPDRRDFTGEITITIDPEDARDFDDAVSLVQQPDGHWLLGVHIADVAHFVPEDSALDREARRRGTSVYLPDRVLPMLPEILSNHLASLQPGRVRYTRSVLIEWTPEGEPISADIVRSAIRSRQRLTYEEVDEFLERPGKRHRRITPEVGQLLVRMRDLAMLLRQRRLTAGSIELNLPEVKIVLDENGRVTGARVIPNTVSHQIIEEFMLAANRAVAETLTQRNVPFLRRVHEPPNPIKLRALTEFVRLLGIPCRSLESRFEIKRVLEAVAGLPTEHAVNYAVLRSMQKAVYSPRELGHYALNWPNYCHFTSPIRRYPDLTIHRLFADLESGRRRRTPKSQLRALGEHCSEREQRAEAAERELVKLKLLYYLHDRIGQRMQAVITGVEEFGIFAQGIDIPAEGFISVSSLQDDRYRFDPAARAFIGYRQGHQFRLGDAVIVEVAHVDLARRELDFRLIGHAPPQRRPAVATEPIRPSVKQSSPPETTARGKKRTSDSTKTKRPRRNKRPDAP